MTTERRVLVLAAWPRLDRRKSREFRKCRRRHRRYSRGAALSLREHSERGWP